MCWLAGSLRSLYCPAGDTCSHIYLTSCWPYLTMMPGQCVKTDDHLDHKVCFLFVFNLKCHNIFAQKVWDGNTHCSHVPNYSLWQQHVLMQWTHHVFNGLICNLKLIILFFFLQAVGYLDLSILHFNRLFWWVRSLFRAWYPVMSSACLWGAL